jgi:hypothetical protein
MLNIAAFQRHHHRRHHHVTGFASRLKNSLPSQRCNRDPFATRLLDVVVEDQKRSAIALLLVFWI